jgi:hypothetical protein
MVKKDIIKKLKKQISLKYPDITGAGLEEISKTVEKEALRKKGKKTKDKKKKKPDCGCDD